MAARVSTWALFLIAQVILSTSFTVLHAATLGPEVIPVGSDPNNAAAAGSNIGSGQESADRSPTLDAVSTSPPLAPNRAVIDSSDELQNIRNNMVGGVEAIRDSIVGLIAFIIGGAQRVVVNKVQGVVDAVNRVENKTILIKDNLQSAGGALVNTWADSLRQTGNITGQLVNSVGENRHLKK